MKVFLGWSGDTSHKVALALHAWIPRVIQTVVPYVSSEDIAKGARWASDIAKELQTSKYGIICVTRDNVNSSWMNFEAGALSREIDQAYVSPFLFDLKPSEIDGPLSQFQHTANSKDDLKKLLFSINDKKEHVLQKDALEDAFEMWWSKLETKLTEIEKEVSNRPAPVKRDTQSMLEELLETTRALRLDSRERSSYQNASMKLIRAENRLMLDAISSLARISEREEKTLWEVGEDGRLLFSDKTVPLSTLLEATRQALGGEPKKSGMPPPPTLEDDTEDK
jgi:hypothetical protein